MVELLNSFHLVTCIRENFRANNKQFLLSKHFTHWHSSPESDWFTQLISCRVNPVPSCAAKVLVNRLYSTLSPATDHLDLTAVLVALQLFSSVISQWKDIWKTLKLNRWAYFRMDVKIFFCFHYQCEKCRMKTSLAYFIWCGIRRQLLWSFLEFNVVRCLYNSLIHSCI